MFLRLASTYLPHPPPPLSYYTGVHVWCIPSAWLLLDSLCVLTTFNFIYLFVKRFQLRPMTSFSVEALSVSIADKDQIWLTTIFAHEFNVDRFWTESINTVLYSVSCCRVLKCEVIFHFNSLHYIVQMQGRLAFLSWEWGYSYVNFICRLHWMPLIVQMQCIQFHFCRFMVLAPLCTIQHSSITWLMFIVREERNLQVGYLVIPSRTECMCVNERG